MYQVDTLKESSFSDRLIHTFAFFGVWFEYLNKQLKMCASKIPLGVGVEEGTSQVTIRSRGPSSEVLSESP